MANLKHAIQQGIVALKAKNIQPVMQTVGDECLLKGKTALVVGGSGGIGKAVAKAFLKNGANVVIAGTRRAKVDKVVLELGEKCAGVVVDLAEPETFSKVIDEAVAFYGPIDILVNSAGVHTEDVSMGGFLDFSVEEFKEFGLEIIALSYDLHNSDYDNEVQTEYERKFSSLGTPINFCEVVF